MLGKRKRTSQIPISRAEISHSPSTSSPESSDTQETSSSPIDTQEIFRRHFEAQFEPLPILDTHSDSNSDIEDDEDADINDDPNEDESDDGWEGLSSEGEDGIEIIEHTVTQPTVMTKEERKRFMSSKPPTSTSTPTTQPSKPTAKETDPNESLNLKNDLALHRLLTESHLLNTNTSSFSATGANRHKATDLRLQSLGAKTSIHKQERMPMSHRKGIALKARVGEEKRRREAKENGIILEVAKAVKRQEGKRDRSVGGPSVGRFKGGTLTLSKNDIKDIEGPKRASSGRGGRGGGRGRSGKKRGKH